MAAIARICCAAGHTLRWNPRKRRYQHIPACAGCDLPPANTNWS